MKQYFYLCIFLIFLLPNNLLAAEKTIIQLKWFHQFQFAGYYAALEKGYYAAEGLNVELRERNPKFDPVNDVLNGEADYGITDSGLIMPALKGKPVVLVAQIFQHSPLILMSQKDEKINKLSDLKGKKITTESNGLTDTSVLAMLLNTFEGLDSFDIQPYSFNYDDLITGETDALAGYITDQPFYFKEKGFDVKIFDPRDYGIDFYGDNLFTTRHEAITNPERVKKIRSATLKGWKYALDNIDEMINLIFEKYNSQKLSRERLEYEAKEIKKLILADFIELGSYQASRFNKIVETYSNLGLVDNIFLPKDFFFNYDDITINLTDKEKHFLKSLPPVRVPIIANQPPLSFIQEGQPKGYLNDLLAQVTRRAGIQVEYVHGFNYKETLEALSQGKVSLLNDYSSFGKQPDYLLQTKPVFTSPFVAVGRVQSESIESMADLKNKRLTLVRGFQQTRTIEKYFPDYNVQLVDNIEQAYQQLRSKKADYYIDNATHAGYYLTNSMISDLKIAGELPKASMGELVLRFAIDKNMPLLHSVLDKTLDSFSPATLESLRRKWLISANNKDTLLSSKEKQWLKEHAVINVVLDPAWAPIEYQDESGEYLGMSIDYLNILEKKLNVRFEIANNLSWDQGVNAIKNKQADMFASVANTPEREQYSIFTKPYIAIPIRIYARDDMSYIGNLQNLSGKTIAIARNYAIHEWLKSNHPELKLAPVDTPADGLIAVSKGQVDVFIGNIITSRYYINKLDLNNVRTAGETPYANNQSMAVRNDWPILANILDKTLTSITESEHDEIFNRWMSLRFEHTINYQLVWIISITALVALMLFFYWNRLLDKKVKKRTRDLAASEEKIRTFYELSPIGIALTDMQGGFLEFNEAFQKICGYTSKELNTLDSSKLTPASYQDEDLQQLKTLNKIGRYGPYEKEYIQKGGEHIPVRVNSVLIKSEDSKSYIWSLVEDITEQKKYQNELHIAKEQAEAANKAKSAFLANMSHEIRTPLNGVLGICQLLQDTQLDESQKELLITMTNSGNSLLTIINDILDFSKIESGKLALESRLFNLYELVESSINLLKPNADKKHILLENNIQDRRLNFIGDETRLSQIIINLLGNAIKFTDDGKVVIAVDINSKTEQEANFTLSITDTGIGISKEKQEIIFNEFTQSDDSITRNFGGTGLGLAISKKLVNLMSGEISVSSELGKGSTFYVNLTLPVSTKISIQQRRKEDQIIQSGSHTILLVEDDKVNQMVATKMLKKLNCKVSVANNGQEAIDILSKQTFDIVFMDMQMPVMDGIKATQLIRKQDNKTIIIAMTANVMKEDRDKCINSGMNDFIPKPIKMNNLNDTLLKWT